MERWDAACEDLEALDRATDRLKRKLAWLAVFALACFVLAALVAAGVRP